MSQQDKQIALELIISRLKLKIISAPKKFRIEWVRGKTELKLLINLLK